MPWKPVREAWLPSYKDDILMPAVEWLTFAEAHRLLSYGEAPPLRRYQAQSTPWHPAVAFNQGVLVHAMAIDVLLRRLISSATERVPTMGQ